MSKQIKTRIQQKHDIEANWIRANDSSSFTPLAGEIIVYDAETQATFDAAYVMLTDTQKTALGRAIPITYERFKIGDGKNTVTNLPFAANTTTIRGGFQAGTDAKASYGGAIGYKADAHTGGAVGQNAKETSGGGAVGKNANTTYGGAVGSDAAATSGGGAVGYKATTGTGGAIGYQASATSGGGAIGYQVSATSGGAIGSSARETNGGAAVGYKASTGAGGAVGNSASATYGGAVGNGAKETDGGGAVGSNASATYGGAVGLQASATSGGAIGQKASTASGFAGGYQAKARYAADGTTEIRGAVAIGYNAVAQAAYAVQLGTGTNTNTNTLQFRDYQLVDTNGKIPADRLPEVDLSDYYTKSETDELISNHYTKSETDELIQNITPKYCEKITYSQLKALRDTDKLIPGLNYRITDFVTTTSQPDTQSAGHPFDIIVTALSSNTLSENASVVSCSGNMPEVLFELGAGGYDANDLVGDFGYEENNIGNTVPVLYMDKGEDGEVNIDYEDKWFYIDEHELDGELYSRWRLIEAGTTEDGNWTWDSIGKKYILTNSIVEDGQITVESADEIEVLFKMYDDDERMYEGFHSDSDVIVELSYGENNEGVVVPMMFKNDIAYINEGPDYGDPIYYVGRYEYRGQTYDRWRKVENNDWDESYHIYLLTDIIVENNKFIDLSDSYFKNAKLEAWEIKYCLDNDKSRFAWAVEGGEQAIINLDSSLSNGRPLTRQPSMDGQSGHDDYLYAWGTQEDVDDGDNTNFWYSQNEVLTNGDTVCRESNFDTVVITELGAGKGVIYYMKDEWDNECHYDFKNIMFKRSADWFADHNDWCDSVMGYTPTEDKWFYTFTWVDENDEVQDLTLIGNSLPDKDGKIYGVFGNKIDICTASRLFLDEISVEALSGNIIVNSYFYADGDCYGCYSNIFGADCDSNTFGHGCYCNVFGSYCSSNTFSNVCVANIFDINCCDNTFGNFCSQNIFGAECYSNTFDSFGSYNTLGSYCSSNTLGDSCNNNVFGNSSGNNTFGDNCSANTFGNICHSNTFGVNCYSNTFDNACIANTFGTQCYDNTFGNGCGDNTFGNCCDSNTFGNECNYIKISEYATRNMFENGIIYVELRNTTQGSYLNPLQNIKVCLGVHGSSTTNPLVITVDRNLEYETKFVASGSKEVII